MIRQREAALERARRDAKAGHPAEAGAPSPDPTGVWRRRFGKTSSDFKVQNECQASGKPTRVGPWLGGDAARGVTLRQRRSQTALRQKVLIRGKQKTLNIVASDRPAK